MTLHAAPTDGEIWRALDAYYDLASPSNPGEWMPGTMAQMRAALIADRALREPVVREECARHCDALVREYQTEVEEDSRRDDTFGARLHASMRDGAASCAFAIRAGHPPASSWRTIAEAQARRPFLVFHRGEYRIVVLHHEADPELDKILPPGTVVDARVGRMWTATEFCDLPPAPGAA